MIEESIITNLISGIILGAAAGITPGPLNALIISESLKHGKKSGIKIALAPLLTDAPIIVASILFISELSSFNHVLGIITIAGAGFILYLGIKDLMLKEFRMDDEVWLNNSFFKGITTNILTPYPYLFWLTIGAPIILETSGHGIIPAVCFVAAFYFLLVGFKILLALFTDKMKKFIHGEYYIRIINSLGILLIAFGIYLIYEGINRVI